MQLVFNGECLDAHNPRAVRRAVVAALKLDATRSARLFPGRRVVLRRAVGLATAQRYIAWFAQMGAALPAPGHKAFAISSRGAHAWHAGAPSQNAAREGALAACMQALPPSRDGCCIVDADGQWEE